MKLIYSVILSIACATLFSAQVAIGKTTTQTGVSLEFGTGPKGLILPWVTAASNVTMNPGANLRGGALIFDRADRKVKLSRNNGSWVDLTVHTNEAPATGGNIVIAAPIQASPAVEQSTAKSQIGGVFSDNTPGILVLADTNKAMIPPLVTNPDTAIRSPAAGMIVYDQTKKLFCVYNGTVWSYWRADN
ncbi:hypothetical protein PGH12_09750 [Chryseobacterium wangxinyae]|uniref:hypothetical protein n=1 Tax=Chryseobacterium sp. CY350 TaxID=2997336 RepID=UPI002270371B|nr:hypothetical protein [Chryseobacterium sp. CY350]MCY0978853.1 hypothetical protein [Chryseobacterium sp. CY350]WBZ93770.1 hypothetical protein PGH12_09750 [Chryseobacterium sp. CY350]